MRPFYSLSAITSILLLGPLPGATAQTAPAVPSASSWYVGVEAAYYRYAQPETVHTAGNATPYLLQPAQVLLGHRFANGLSLEASFMRSQRAASANSDRVYDNNSYYYYSTESVQTSAVSVLMRAPLLQASTGRRWQLDGKIGLTFLKTHFTEKYYFAWSSSPVAPAPAWEERRELGDLPVTLGLGASYRVAPHLQLTADASAHLSWVLCFAKLFGASGSPVGGGGSVGLRYNL